MALVSLGAVTFTGTGPVKATINGLPYDSPTGYVGAHIFRVTSLPTNTGTAYVGRSDMDLINLDGVFGVIPKPNPTVQEVAPYYESPENDRGNLIDMSTIYVDGKAGDTVLISYFEE